MARRADAGRVRRGRAPCPQRGRGAGPAARRRGRGGCDRRRSRPDPLDPGRGASRIAGCTMAPQFVENSLTAFAAALEFGAGIECDLRLTADDQIVVFHDPRCRAPVRRSAIDRPLDARRARPSAPSAAARSRRSPQLLELVAARAPLLLEVKVDGDASASAAALVGALADYRGPVRRDELRSAADALAQGQCPQVRRGLVVRDSLSPVQALDRDELRRSRISSPSNRRARASRGWRAARDAMPVYSWTVRNPRAARHRRGPRRRADLGSRWPTVTRLTARIAPRVGEVDAALRGTASPARRSVPVATLPGLLETRAASGRAAAGRPLPCWSRRGGADDRRGAGLSQDPQPGRICLRSWLGRGVGAGRRGLLSQAAGGGAVHPGARGAAARRPARRCSPRSRAVTVQNELSSAHITFASTMPVPRRARRAAGSMRHGLQYHWHNRGYARFRRFPRPPCPAASARRSARSARRRSRGSRSSRCAARRSSPTDWDAMWHFYQDTGRRKWGQPYLTRAFFDQVGAAMGEACLLFLAFATAADRRRAQLHRRGYALRPLLGRDRGGAVPPFRAELLSRDRVGDRARPGHGPGGRAGRAQTGARL